MDIKLEIMGVKKLIKFIDENKVPGTRYKFTLYGDLIEKNGSLLTSTFMLGYHNAGEWLISLDDEDLEYLYKKYKPEAIKQIEKDKEEAKRKARIKLNATREKLAEYERELKELENE